MLQLTDVHCQEMTFHLVQFVIQWSKFMIVIVLTILKVEKNAIKFNLKYNPAKFEIFINISIIVTYSINLFYIVRIKIKIF